MTKAKLLEILSEVADDARIAMVHQNGRVVDIEETLVQHAKPNWLDHDEVHLFQQRAPT